MDHDRLEAFRREQERRQRSYRERALKLFPWVCARCGREFDGPRVRELTPDGRRKTPGSSDGPRVRELTVHHKDHDHQNNPPDGSNWELLCLYCHEQEHLRGLADPADHQGPAEPTMPSATHQPFAGLAERLRQPPASDSDEG